MDLSVKLASRLVSHRRGDGRAGRGRGGASTAAATGWSYGYSNVFSNFWLYWYLDAVLWQTLRGPFSAVSKPILQGNTLLKALDEIYNIYKLLHRLNPI